MTREEMIKLLKEVDLRTDYQPVKTCPNIAAEHESTSRTFLGEEGVTTNVLGKPDKEVLRSFCFNGPENCR